MLFDEMFEFNVTILFRTIQRDNFRLLANVFAEHLRGLRQLPMSLLLNLQRSIQIINLTRTNLLDRQRSHLPTFQDSQQHQLDSTLERLARELS